MVPLESPCCPLAVRTVHKDAKCCRNCSKSTNHLYRVKNSEKERTFPYLWALPPTTWMSSSNSIFLLLSQIFKNSSQGFKSVETNITVIAFHFFEVICCLNLLEMKFKDIISKDCTHLVQIVVKWCIQNEQPDYFLKSFFFNENL